MNRRYAIWIGLLTASSCIADVAEWGGRTLGTDYDVIDDINVVIKANGTFKFQAEDGSSNLDVIGNITVADGVTGTVTVYIERDTDDDSPGATNVGSINLTNDQGSSLTGDLAELRITGNLGTVANSVVTGITGVVDIENDLERNLSASTVTGGWHAFAVLRVSMRSGGGTADEIGARAAAPSQARRRGPGFGWSEAG